MGGRDEYMLNGKRRREADDDNGSLFAAFLAFFFSFFPELIHRAPALFCDPDSWESGQVFWG